MIRNTFWTSISDIRITLKKVAETLLLKKIPTYSEKERCDMLYLMVASSGFYWASLMLGKMRVGQMMEIWMDVHLK